ncbi:peptidylprolyl isomerase [Adhaeribacter rhizoryzae]|uniref:Peptidylprolyl isomerase n=1 Tax=Adhaeribacter rhizoryzae TaxID=2607907 RepID=A0A5M6DT60_9BACT|nr:peptidylprolyl isomerase [Adhaeribacter rhizoryzae]KAA5549449.1 peptidylprolyl isomerase [Adhaeribacter rhizoryzae]
MIFKSGLQILSKHTFFSLVLLLVTSVAWAQQRSKALDGIIVKVNNQIILRSDLQTAVAQEEAQAQKKLSDQDRCDILRALVQQKLLVARAEIDSVVVDQETIEGTLDQRMAYFVSQIGSEQKLEEYYNKSIKQIKDDLRKPIKEQLIAEKMQGEITQKLSVTPNDVKKFFNKIPQDSLPYFSTEVEIGQIVKLAGVSKTQKDEVRNRLLELKKRIQAGESFATLATQYSEDPGSAAKGGELGFFKKRELVPEYEAAALKLEPGQLTDVIESQFGFHLIQLIERRGEEYNTRHILLKPNSTNIDMEATAAELNKLRARIQSDSISFSKAAKDFSDDKVTKDNGGLMMSPRDRSTFIPLDQVDPSIFFIIDTMKVGSITKPLEYRTEDGKQAMRIIYLKSNTPPHQANLKDDYQKLATYALNEKRRKALSDWFEKNKNTVYIDIDPEFNNCDILQGNLF